MKLSLSNRNLNNIDMADLMNKIDPNITALFLSNNNIGDAGAQALAQNTTLTILVLTNNNISDAGAQALAQNTTLERLWLDDNEITDTGAKALARNTTLTELRLGSTYIGDDGAKALAKNKTLAILMLDGTEIGNEGAHALAQNKTLVSLILDNTLVKDDGAKSFLHNYHLQRLGLEDNKISNALYHQIQIHIKENNKRLELRESGYRTLKKDITTKQRVTKMFKSGLDARPGSMQWAQFMGEAYSMGMTQDIDRLKENCMEAVYWDHNNIMQHYTRDHLYFMALGLGLTPARHRTKRELCFLLTFDGGVLDCNRLGEYSLKELQVLAEGYRGDDNANIMNYTKGKLCQYIKRRFR